jgi:hypothetical protein
MLFSATSLAIEITETNSWHPAWLRASNSGWPHWLREPPHCGPDLDHTIAGARRLTLLSPASASSIASSTLSAVRWARGALPDREGAGNG